MLYEVRTDREDKSLPKGTSSVSPDAFDQALKDIEKSNHPAEAKREAFALISIGKRFYSRGAYSWAQRYLEQGRSVRDAPSFVKIKGDEVMAKRVTHPVELDGVLNEWQGVQPVFLKGSATSGGMFMAMWDAETIYIAVTVRDAVLKDYGEQGTGFNWRWGFDGVVIRLGASDTCTLTPSGFPDILLPDGYSVVYAAVSGRKYGYPISGVSPANVRFAVKKIDGGYVMEVAIPAREYMILPLAGASVGFDIQLKGAAGSFCRYSKREGAYQDGLRLGRLYFSNDSP